MVPMECGLISQYTVPPHSKASPQLSQIIGDAQESLLRPANQPANMFGSLITDITSALPGIPATNLLVIIFGDTGEDDGKVFFVDNWIKAGTRD